MTLDELRAIGTVSVKKSASGCCCSATAVFKADGLTYTVNTNGLHLSPWDAINDLLKRSGRHQDFLKLFEKKREEV